ncbi:hypothetical protein LLG88_10800, partial [bacterium]|nr:hypothetical protein [bacterium]
AGLAFASALDVRTKEANPRKWAANHYNIGNSLVELAEFAQASGVGTARMLAQAVASFRHALEVLTKDAEPVWWAQAQGRLGTALGMEALLAKGDDAAQLWSEAAVAARHALEVWTEDGNRQNWVAAQNLLRIALKQQESQRPPTPGRRAPAGARRR